ncbi:AcrR family transcriptional regulator [Crossiella equi]|uniref:AcrR family transcriptional regulator n=1 Tax=Crossiella equi TaxID=130796 RepID=A0ABS5AEX5_9PSEU|nr:TetR family transcriptional regulator [Crossiella equi]MBP2475138.1 AcrR family transcriptional regulator [Crossiella equi]
MTQAARTRGRLNRELVLAKAIELMDAAGLDGLTIRALAAALGARPMAIYTYFAGKDELLVAAYEELVSRLPLPVVEDGVEGLKRHLRERRAQMLAHPCALQLLVWLDRPTEHDLRLGEAAYSCLLHAGLSPRDALVRAAAASWLVVGNLVSKTARANPEGQVPEFAPEVFPALHAVAAALSGLDADAMFEAGLELALGAAASS